MKKYLLFFICFFLISCFYQEEQKTLINVEKTQLEEGLLGTVSVGSIIKFYDTGDDRWKKIMQYILKTEEVISLGISQSSFLDSIHFFDGEQLIIGIDPELFTIENLQKIAKARGNTLTLNVDFGGIKKEKAILVLNGEISKIIKKFQFKKVNLYVNNNLTFGKLHCLPKAKKILTEICDKK